MEKNREEMKQAYYHLNKAYNYLIDLENELLLEVAEKEREKIDGVFIDDLADWQNTIDDIQGNVGQFLETKIRKVLLSQ